MLGESTSVLGSSGGGSGGGGGGGGGGGDVAGAHHLDGGEIGGGIGSNSGEEGDRSFAGNRWPRQETLALLKIRADMGVMFRDANMKGPLWDEVSRKLSELGFHRSAKKCKEKFENVYKYHRRTKDGRGGKSEGKSYRFFEQMEALENHALTFPSATHPRPQTPATTITAMPVVTTVPSTPHVSQNFLAHSSIFSQQPNNPQTFISPNFTSNSNSSTSSDEDLEKRENKNPRWKRFFEKLMKEVMEKQEKLHQKFLESIEKHEQERVAREESWRLQEISRINREREILDHERAMAAAKDAAVMAFLQKIAQQNNTQIILPPPPPPPQPPPAPPSAPPQTAADMNEENFKPSQSSSSRWPKIEVEALIKLRTNLDSKYQENVPKGPLWEEISSGMKKLGYNRNPKRCKEKWENINKYFKKVKESNRKRPEDSKTCPYFNQLDVLYREKNKNDSSSSNNQLKFDDMTPLMVQPEQQWPPQPPLLNQEHHHHGPDLMMEDMDSEHIDQNQEEDDDTEDGGEFEVVANTRPV